jgi:hypothetical protein
VEVRLDVADGSREAFGVSIISTQDVKCQALCAFSADAWEFLKLLDQARHGFSKGH